MGLGDFIKNNATIYLDKLSMHGKPIFERNLIIIFIKDNINYPILLFLFAKILVIYCGIVIFLWCD